MLEHNTESSTASQVDLMAIDALFKRIAQRGRRVRTQAQAVKSETKDEGLKPAKHKKQLGRIHNNHK